MFATIHTITPFDASVGTNINFTWSGNQIYKVRCIIKNNATGITVYDNTIDTMKQAYQLSPTSALLNGIKHVAYITVFDVDGNESTMQNIGTPFYCFSTPTFNLSIENGDIIRASSFSIGLSYSQQESELLNWFNITLFSYQKTLIDSSGQIYDTTDLSYIVSNLQNATQYYIRATGETVNGMSLDTGYVLVTISYTTAQIFSKLELNNIPETGAIEIKSNIISAEGVPENEVAYIDVEYADLRDNSVTFDEGFEVDGNFTKIFNFSKPARNKEIIQFGTSDGLKVNVFYRQGCYSDSNGEKGYFELVANSCGINYISNSNYVDILAGDYYYKYSLLIRRKNGLFDLKALARGTIIRYSPNANGSNMTEIRQPNSQYIGIGYMPKEVLDHENLFVLTNQNNKNPIIKEWNGKGITNSKVLLSWTDGYKFKITSTDTNDPCYRPIPATQNLSRYSSLLLSFKYNTSSRKSRVRFAQEADNNILLLGDYTGEIKHKIISNNSYSSLYISFDPGVENMIGTGASAIGESLTLWDLKLEEGTVATSWTPAPSDWLADPSNYEWIPL